MQVPKDIITRAIGLVIIAFVILSYFKILKFKPNNLTIVIVGALVGLVSGLVGKPDCINNIFYSSLIHIARLQ